MLAGLHVIGFAVWEVCKPTIKRFEEIEAWQTARELARRVYSLTDEGKFSRDFGLKDQIRRASVSVMSNIAEGFESQTQSQFIRYLGVAKASAGEVRSHTKSSPTFKPANLPTFELGNLPT
ncbi:MAG: four helix bundle protein [Chloroflexota bacterium]